MLVSCKPFDISPTTVLLPTQEDTHPEHSTLLPNVRPIPFLVHLLLLKSQVSIFRLTAFNSRYCPTKDSWWFHRIYQQTVLAPTIASYITSNTTTTVQHIDASNYNSSTDTTDPASMNPLLRRRPLGIGLQVVVRLRPLSNTYTYHTIHQPTLWNMLLIPSNFVDECPQVTPGDLLRYWWVQEAGGFGIDVSVTGSIFC